MFIEKIFYNIVVNDGKAENINFSNIRYKDLPEIYQSSSSIRRSFYNLVVSAMNMVKDRYFLPQPPALEREYGIDKYQLAVDILDHNPEYNGCLVGSYYSDGVFVIRQRSLWKYLMGFQYEILRGKFCVVHST